MCKMWVKTNRRIVITLKPQPEYNIKVSVDALPKLPEIQQTDNRVSDQDLAGIFAISWKKNFLYELYTLSKKIEWIRRYLGDRTALHALYK